MSEVDAHLGCHLQCLATYLVPVIVLFVVLKFTGVFRSLRLKAQSFAMQKLAPASDALPAVKNAKKALFKTLHDFKTPPVILEVGAGECRNVEYYPDNSSYIVVEPNKNFDQPLRKRVAEAGAHLKLEAVYTDYAEKLEHVESESIDAYVMTHVMCCFKDIEVVLKEARRVLKPGGRLYIFHHFVGPNASIRTPRFFLEHYIIMPILTGIMECNPDMYIEAAIRRHFPKTDLQIVELPFNMISLRYHLISDSLKERISE